MWSYGPQSCLTQWNYEPCWVGPPKMDGSWWRVLRKRGPLEQGTANHLSILALRTRRTVWKVKKQQLELDVEQQTGSKLGKEYINGVYCHPAYLTYMQSTSCEMPGWKKHKLESRLPGEIPITSDTGNTTLMAESEEELKSLLKVRQESKKLVKNSTLKKLRSWPLVPLLHGE